MSNEYLPPQSDVASTQAMDNPPLFSPHGRIGRIRYLAHNFWMSSVVYLIGFGIIFAAGAVSETLVDIASLLFMLALLAVMFLLTIKRSHDINLSGWWSILALIPLVNLFFVFKSGTPEQNNYGPVPKPNTALLWIGGLALPIVFFVGILAAIAIPAYQDYTGRAQIGMVFVEASPIKTAMAEFAQPTSNWPSQDDLVELNLHEPIVSEFATLYARPDTGAIEAVMRESPPVMPSIANGTITFSPVIGDDNVLRYNCKSDDIAPKYLPRGCRER